MNAQDGGDGGRLPDLVVVPTYNEADNIAAVIGSVLGAAPSAELLVVDDSSPDGTDRCVAAIGRGNPRVHLLRREGKQGIGTACIAGFHWALRQPYRHIVQMDADLSHDPAMVPVMLRAADDFDVVIGSRYCCGGRTVAQWPRARRWLSGAANAYARSVLGTRIRDMTSGFRCWRRSVLERIDLSAVRCRGCGFQVEMTAAALALGASVLELPIAFAQRQKGSSKLDWGQAWEAAWNVLVLSRRS